MQKLKNSSLILAAVLCGLCPRAQKPNLPFPNHTNYLQGVLPDISDRRKMDEEVLNFFNLWAAKYIKYYDRDSTAYVYVKGRHTKDICVSEGIGYGMMILALMTEPDNSAKNKATFDRIFKFYQNHPGKRDAVGERKRINSVLMASAQKEKWGRIVNSDWTSAADGDIDIAYALLLADKQWSSKFNVNYLSEAKKIIAAIYDEEVNKEKHTIVMSNASQKDGSSDYFDFRSSDFIPSELREFAYVSPGENWSTVIRTNYSIFSAIQAAYSPNNGLFADFYMLQNGHYVPGRRSGSERTNSAHYAYNACRLPWRIGADYLLFGEVKARALLAPLNKWIISATKGNPKKINAGYSLNGVPAKKGEDTLMMSFIAPFAISAMTDVKYKGWLNSLWKTIVAMPISPAGAYSEQEYGYYENTIKLLCMITLSGNYWTPSRHESTAGKH